MICFDVAIPYLRDPATTLKITTLVEHIKIRARDLQAVALLTEKTTAIPSLVFALNPYHCWFCSSTATLPLINKICTFLQQNAIFNDF
jgi:hypothetical protein